MAAFSYQLFEVAVPDEYELSHVRLERGQGLVVGAGGLLVRVGHLWLSASFGGLTTGGDITATNQLGNHLRSKHLKKDH